MTVTWEQALDAAYARLRLVMVERHKKYGPENMAVSRQILGEAGLQARVIDKTMRWIRSSGIGPVNDEGDDDPLIDLANYAVITLMLRQGTWENPAHCLGQVDDERQDC